MKLFPLVLSGLLLAASVLPVRAGLSDGLLASLPMRDDLQDHGPSKLPVNVVGKVVLHEGAAYFPGDGNWLELPYLPLDHRPFAVSLWVRPTGSFPTYGLVEQYDSNENNHILHLVLRDGLHARLGFYNNDAVSPIGLSNAGGWQHLVFQYAEGCQEIWINGRLICRLAAEPYEGTSGTTCIGKIEKWNNVPGRDLEGYLSDVRIYGRALAVKEVRELARSRPPGEGAAKDVTGPVPAARTDEAAAIPLLDVNGGTVRISGEPGEIYTVEGSTDTDKWETLGAVTVGREGYVDVVDQNAGKYDERQYRMRYGAAR